MKKIFPLLFLFLLIESAMAQNEASPAGWITIDLNSFMCQKATNDDFLNFDGFGDEVYFVIYYSVLDKNGVTRYSNKLVSKTYGDTYRFPDRVLAGHANPDNKGGMSTGSQFFPGNEFPDIKRVRLEAGDYITVIPTIWEWDNNSNSQLQHAIDNRIINSFNTINQPIPGILQYCYGGYKCYQFTNLGVIHIPTFADLLKSINGVNGSRPIGISKAGEFSPLVFSLKSQMIISQNKSNPIDGKTYSMNYNDFVINEESMGNTRDHGIYMLRFHFTFEKDLSKPAPPPAPSPAGNNNVIVNPPRPVKQVIPVKNSNIKLPSTPVNNELMSGVWKGTTGTMTSATDGPLNFKCSNYGFWLLNNNGSGTAVVAGGYNFENGNFTGSYTDSNNWKWIYTSTGYNTQTGELSGSWTCTGSGYYKTGKWIMKKISN